MAFKKLEPVFDWSGKRRLTADAGRKIGEEKPVFKCKCGGYVVRVKSAKTGKNYSANCYRYHNLTGTDFISYWYAAHSPHYKTCKEQTKMRDQMTEGK